MKNLTLLFLFLYSFQLVSQVPYTSFDLENSTWEESDGALWFLQTFREVYADGDTIIGGKTFQKLREEGITYFYDSPMQTTISDSILFDNYYGAIRENDQKQIEIGFNDTSLILYDFNIAVGDSIEILAPGPGFLPAHVYDRDTVEVCGTLRNRYHIKVIQAPLEYGYTTLTEGVGSSNGLKIETTKFYHLQIRDNEIIETLEERSLLMEDLKLTFFDKDGEKDYSFEADIVELTEEFLWLKYVSPSGYTFQYKYRRI